MAEHPEHLAAYLKGRRLGLGAKRTPALGIVLPDAPAELAEQLLLERACTPELVERVACAAAQVSELLAECLQRESVAV